MGSHLDGSSFLNPLWHETSNDLLTAICMYYEKDFEKNLDGGSKICNSMPKQKEILFNLFLQLGKLGL